MSARLVALMLAGLVFASLAAISPTASAQSRVGITSATSGDPLGKRVLHVGVDVQAK